MKAAIVLALFTLPLIMAMVSVREAENRYQRVVEKIRSKR